MKVFLITFTIVCVLLCLLFVLCGKKNQAKVIGFFLENPDTPPSRPYISLKSFKSSPKTSGSQTTAKPQKKTPTSKSNRRNPNQAYTEMAILQQKIDERRRVVDSSGHSKLYDEYFELVFETRKGETLRLVTSRAAFKEIPFNQEGALTHKKGVLVKFKYTGGLVSDEFSPIHNEP